MTSTARTGNPGHASRGSAVARAKRALGDAIDARLDLEAIAVEQREMEILGEVIGCSADDARLMLESATLENLETWIESVKQTAARAAGDAG